MTGSNSGCGKTQVCNDKVKSVYCSFYRDLVDKNVNFEGHILYAAEVCFAHLFKLYDQIVT